MREYRRSLEQVLFEDMLLTSGGEILALDPDEGVRQFAIAEVLRSLPDEDYMALVAIRDSEDESFDWLVPDVEELAGVKPFPALYAPPASANGRVEYKRQARVLYLSPALERRSRAVAVAVVAHELAHIVLRHRVVGIEDYDLQESEAWAKVNEWGFGDEIKKHHALKKRQESHWQSLSRSLSEGGSGSPEG